MADTPISPAADSWAAAIHRSPEDLSPIGAGFVIDDRHVLTCAHILRHDDTPLDRVWVTFPKAGVAKSDGRQSMPLSPKHMNRSLDVALLRLEQPVPAAV